MLKCEYVNIINLAPQIQKINKVAILRPVFHLVGDLPFLIL